MIRGEKYTMWGESGKVFAIEMKLENERHNANKR